MIKITLNKFVAEDFKCIQTLKNMGVSEELIQFGYNNTQNKREIVFTFLIFV